MQLILCGLPKSGKTTLGQLLAQALKYNFVDTDALIECETGTTCPNLMQKYGENYFRKIEQNVVAKLEEKKDRVIATGGGTFLNSANVSHLKSIGFIIYLQADPTALFQRFDNQLPAYIDSTNPFASFMVLVQKRISIYEHSCHLKIETNNRDPETIRNQILDFLTLRLSKDFLISDRTV